MKSSKTSHVKLIDTMVGGGHVLDPHSPANLEPTTDMVELNRRNTQAVSYDLLKKRFGEHLLELYLLGSEKGGDIKDMLVVDAGDSIVSHLGHVNSSDTNEINAHGRSLLKILRDKRHLVIIEKKFGESHFNHGEEDEVTTTLAKTMRIKVNAKTRHEAVYKAFCRLLKQERAMTVNEKGLGEYISAKDIKSLILANAYKDTDFEMVFDGATYTVTHDYTTE